MQEIHQFWVLACLLILYFFFDFFMLAENVLYLLINLYIEGGRYPDWLTDGINNAQPKQFKIQLCNFKNLFLFLCPIRHFRSDFSKFAHLGRGEGAKHVFHIYLDISKENANIYMVFVLKCNKHKHKNQFLGILDICFRCFVKTKSWIVRGEDEDGFQPKLLKMQLWKFRKLFLFCPRLKQFF